MCTRHVFTDRVKEIRVDIDHEFEAWYIDSKRIAGELQVEEKVPRTCGRQTKRKNINISNLSEYFKFTVAIPFLDYLSQELSTGTDFRWTLR